MGSSRPDPSTIMKTLERFAGGGYYETKLRDEDYSVHPHHDEIFRDSSNTTDDKLPDLAKFFLDDSLPEFMEMAKEDGKFWFYY